MVFEGTRECIAVHKNSKGACQCTAYGPLGSQRKTFNQLCREKNLPINVGDCGKRGIDMRGSMEYPPIEDLDLADMWGGLDFPPIGFPITRDALTAAGAAGAGMMLASWGTKKVPFLSTPNWRAGASIAAGLLGGYLLYDYNRPAATGLAAGMVGLGLATLLTQLTKIPVSLEAGTYREEDLLGLGLGDAVVDEETMLTGLGAGTDEDLFGDAEVDTVQPYEMSDITSIL